MSCCIVVTVGFIHDGYTISEGETVNLVVQKVGVFETDIEFEITSGEMFIGDGVFSAGGTENITNILIPLTAPDNDIALEDDIMLLIKLNLLTSSSLITEFNSVINVVITDNDGE